MTGELVVPARAPPYGVRRRTPLSPLPVAIWLLIRILGTPALAGVALLLLMMPILGKLGDYQRVLRGAHLKHIDARVRLCGEAARGMRGLKFAGWRAPAPAVTVAAPAR